jgi:hypothetical protein
MKFLSEIAPAVTQGFILFKIHVLVATHSAKLVLDRQLLIVQAAYLEDICLLQGQDFVLSVHLNVKNV